MEKDALLGLLFRSITLRQLFAVEKANYPIFSSSAENIIASRRSLSLALLSCKAL
jgi:hypothetical protein